MTRYSIHLVYALTRPEYPPTGRGWIADMSGTVGGDRGDLKDVELEWEETDDGWTLDVDGVLSTSFDDLSSEEAHEISDDVFLEAQENLYPEVRIELAAKKLSVSDTRKLKNKLLR